MASWESPAEAQAVLTAAASAPTISLMLTMLAISTWFARGNSLLVTCSDSPSAPVERCCSGPEHVQLVSSMAFLPAAEAFLRARYPEALAQLIAASSHSATATASTNGRELELLTDWDADAELTMDMLRLLSDALQVVQGPLDVLGK
jgi:hypothetical protein